MLWQDKMTPIRCPASSQNTAGGVGINGCLFQAQESSLLFLLQHIAERLPISSCVDWCEGFNSVVPVQTKFICKPNLRMDTNKGFVPSNGQFFSSGRHTDPGLSWSPTRADQDPSPLLWCCLIFDQNVGWSEFSFSAWVLVAFQPVEARPSKTWLFCLWCTWSWNLCGTHTFLTTYVAEWGHNVAVLVGDLSGSCVIAELWCVNDVCRLIFVSTQIMRSRPAIAGVLSDEVFFMVAEVNWRLRQETFDLHPGIRVVAVCFTQPAQSNWWIKRAGGTEHVSLAHLGGFQGLVRNQVCTTTRS